MRGSNQFVWMPLHRYPLLGMLKGLFFYTFRHGGCHLVKIAR